jgi:hypothetical protein
VVDPHAAVARIGESAVNPWGGYARAGSVLMSTVEFLPWALSLEHLDRDLRCCSSINDG